MATISKICCYLLILSFLEDFIYLLSMLKVGIISYGERIQEQIAILSELNCFEIVGVLPTTPLPDNSVISSDLLIEEFDVLCNKTDALFLFSSKAYYYEEIAYMIKKAKAIYIKKTGHLEVHQLKSLAALALESNCKVMVGNYMLYRELSSLLFEQTTTPKLIEAQLAYPLVETPRFNITLSQLLYTELAFLIRLAKGDPAKVRATGCTTISANKVDVIIARIDFNNGATVNIHASILPFETERTIKIYQPDSVIYADYICNSINHLFPTKQTKNLSDQSKARAKEYQAFYDFCNNNTTEVHSLNEDILIWEITNQLDQKVQLFT
ncbi:hypothetical protein EMN47_04725 [Prolixibacteraceae bacterium JC049]|nr:hypothetical protein [Prolixibacteraceae bacterium JC049]